MPMIRTYFFKEITKREKKTKHDIKLQKNRKLDTLSGDRVVLTRADNEDGNTRHNQL